MTPSEILDVIIIVYYVPALLLSLFVAYKHGFGRQSGWITLTLLSIFRLVGSSLGIATVSSPSEGVIAGALILSNMGTVSLLGALVGISKRVNDNMSDHALPAQLTRFVQAPTLAAIILSIIGGNWAFDSDSNTRSEGHTLTKAAIILLLVVYLVAVGFIANETVNKRYILAEENRLLKVTTLALPFVLVRLILAFCSAFRATDPDFSIVSTTNTAVIIRALMGILMEWIVVAWFLWAGCTVDATTELRRQAGQAWHGSIGARQGTTVQQQETEHAMKAHP